jgi:hypothetical protein
MGVTTTISKLEALCMWGRNLLMEDEALADGTRVIRREQEKLIFLFVEARRASYAC